MKNLIYITALGITWLFSACQDVTVGYLIVDEAAGYAKDTMYIVTKAENELQRLKNIEANFYLQTQKLQDEITELETKREELDDEYMMELEEIQAPLYEEWDALDANPPEDEDEYMRESDRIYDLIMQAQDEMDEKYEPLYAEADLALDEKKSELEHLAETLGLESPEIRKQKIADIQQRVDFQLIWTTPAIDGVQGTEPLVYTVIAVKAEKPENAAKFINCIRGVGKGILYVDYNPDAPAGTYTITLQIENEGRTRVLEDVFTFVLQDVPAEEPLPEVPEIPEEPEV